MDLATDSQAAGRAPGAVAAAEHTRAGAPATRLTVIVPATNEPPYLHRVLPPIEAGLHAGEELIVVTDPPNAGPAEARNAGAEHAMGNVLVFVDADVVIHADALARLRTAFDVDPGLAAVFGAYDDGPTNPAVISQFRNLLHHHVHLSCPGEAGTFWAGLGAVRLEAFLAVGGFDVARFAVPSIEDIELGARLHAAGYRIELHPRVQGTHLKHWTFVNMVRTDLLLRGIPWVRLMLEHRSAPTTLNLSVRERASTILTMLAVPPALFGRPRPVLGLALVVTLLNAPFYWILVRRMGLIRALAGMGLHALHRAIAVVSVPSGLLVHLWARRRRRA